MPRAIGGFQQHYRNIIAALEERVDVVEFGRYDAPIADDLPDNATILATAETRGAFAARLIRDYLTRGPTVFLIGHPHLLRVLAAVPRNPRHRLLLSFAGTDAWYPQDRLARAAFRLVDSANFIARYNELIFNAYNRASLPEHYTSRSIWLPVPEADERVTPDPVPTRQQRRCVFVSRIMRSDPLKGLDTLIDAMSLLGDDWALDAVGGGDAIEEYRARADAKGCAHRVEFHGRVSNERRASLIADADVLALPSAQEGFGIVFLEAMVRGRPCVGAASGAIPEVIPENVGELAPYGDAPRLAKALQRASDRLRSGEITPESIRSVYEERYAWRHFREGWQKYVRAFV